MKVYPAGVFSFAGNNHVLTQKTVAGFDVFSASVKPYVPDIKKRSISSKVATLSLPLKLPDNVSDLILKVDYLGASCDVLQHGKVVSDNLMNGFPWLIATHLFLKKTPVELLIHDWDDKITGLDPKQIDKIRTSGSIFRSIEVMPQYSMDIGFAEKIVITK